MITWTGNKKRRDKVNREMLSKQTRYDSLVRALHGDLFRYAFWLCHDQSVAEDLVQESLLRAWKALDSLKDEKSAKSWLITIVRRENARRFERKRFDMADIELAQVADHQLSTEDQQEQHQLRLLISQLEDDYREPLILQILYGFSGDEIANILGLKRNTVMTRLFRARNQLREVMDPIERKGKNNG